MAAAAAHGDGDVDARPLRRVLDAIGRGKFAQRLTRPIRAVRRRSTGQRLHPRIALGLAARLRTLYRRLRQVQRRLSLWLRLPPTVMAMLMPAPCAASLTLSAEASLPSD